MMQWVRSRWHPSQVQPNQVPSTPPFQWPQPFHLLHLHHKLNQTSIYIYRDKYMYIYIIIHACMRGITLMFFPGSAGGAISSSLMQPFPLMHPKKQHKYNIHTYILT